MLDTFKTPGDTDWFVRDRFGLFIHWGLYALPARHEWVKSKEKVSEEHYDKYFRYFEPDLYDPRQWADAAARAGMKYFVITTKHHDGFCLWDSKHTDYKSTKAPNCGRDLLRPMIEAFNERGLRTGLYHSLIDWHHPQYIIDRRNHPRRDDLPRVEGVAVDGMIAQAGGDSASKTATVVADLNKGRDQAKYAKYLHDQVRELLTEFGKVEVLWFDFSFADGKDRTDFTMGKGWEAWKSDELYKMIRELQPGVILTNRLDLPMPLSGGDMLTPEQAQPRGWVHADINGQRVPVVWEACQTFSGSWGYHRDESSWRSVEQLVQTLIDCVSKGGNLLLNVGPTARGEFDARAMDRLDGIGVWMRKHSRSIYGCTQAPAEFTAPQDCRLTYNPANKRLYVHLFAWPYKFLHLEGDAFVDRVEYAQLLHDASEVRALPKDDWHGKQIAVGGRTLTVILPQTRPDVTVPVIELMLK
jgi:alpha-L-fucosidase